MDLETENRIAAILLKEAAEIRRQAQTEGALSYLRQPTTRSRPNSRFLTATVLGVQQANRVVEVNEMWRLREKQLELDNRLRGKIHESTSGRGDSHTFGSRRSSNSGCSEVEPNASASHLSKRKTIHDQIPTEGHGLRDDEVDEFLQSRTKRGRGAVGSRMDETGPYLPSSPDSKRITAKSPDEELGKPRVLLGPEKPISLAYSRASDDESVRVKKRKKKMSLGKHYSKKHKSREESNGKKKKEKKKTWMDEKKRKHHR